jgi:adenylate kinase
MMNSTAKADAPTITKKQDVVRQWLGTGSINLFGLPLAGKEAQAQRLAKWLGAEVIQGGEILRQADLPPHVAAMRDAGDLIPVEDYLKIIIPYLLDVRLSGKPLVYSSLGRYHGEEESIVRASRESGHPLRLVVLLQVDEDAIWRRWRARHDSLARGFRPDDSKGALENRLIEYRTKTIPVLESYCRRGLLVKVEGGGSHEEVEAALLDALFNFASRETLA